MALSEAVSALTKSSVTAAIFGLHTLPMTDVLRPVVQRVYRVPEDLYIICVQCDEIAKNIIYPMTSVRFDINAAAARATKMLIDQL